MGFDVGFVNQDSRVRIEFGNEAFRIQVSWDFQLLFFSRGQGFQNLRSRALWEVLG